MRNDRTMDCGHTPESCDCDPTPEQEAAAEREEFDWDHGGFDCDEDCCPFCYEPLEARRICGDDYEYYCPECEYVSHTD